MPFSFAFLLDTTDGPQTVLPPGKKKKKNLSKNFPLKSKNCETIKKSLLTVHTTRCNLHEKGCVI